MSKKKSHSKKKSSPKKSKAEAEKKVDPDKFRIPDDALTPEDLIVLDRDEIEALQANADFVRLASTFSSQDVLAYVQIGFSSFADYLGLRDSEYRTREHLPVVIARGRVDLARAFIKELASE